MSIDDFKTMTTGDEKCERCRGRGIIKRIWHFRHGYMPPEVDCSYDCDECGGTGKKQDKP